MPQDNQLRKCCRHAAQKLPAPAKHIIDRGTWLTESVVRGMSRRGISSSRRRLIEARAAHKERRREIWPRPGNGVHRDQGYRLLKGEPCQLDNTIQCVRVRGCGKEIPWD